MQPGPYRPVPGGGGCGAATPRNIRITFRFSSLPIRNDSPPIDVGVPPSRQWSVESDADLAPRELSELPGREVGGERRDQVVREERQPHERREARHVVADRPHDRLLPLAARDVGLGGVEPVLADA